MLNNINYICRSIRTVLLIVTDCLQVHQNSATDCNWLTVYRSIRTVLLIVTDCVYRSTRTVLLIVTDCMCRSVSTVHCRADSVEFSNPVDTIQLCTNTEHSRKWTSGYQKLKHVHTHTHTHTKQTNKKHPVTLPLFFFLNRLAHNGQFPTEWMNVTD